MKEDRKTGWAKPDGAWLNHYFIKGIVQCRGPFNWPKEPVQLVNKGFCGACKEIAEREASSRATEASSHNCPHVDSGEKR